MNLPYSNALAILNKYDLKADKSLGQNFLQEPEYLEAISQAADIAPGDTVLEIGPGLGSLTRYLSLLAQSVTAVELDHDLIPVLQDILTPYPNVKIIEGDILRISPSSLFGTSSYLVVANVPYYITSAIFRHLLDSNPRPKRIVLTVQKEVAERICAKPGDLSLLALSVQIFGTPEIVKIIPAEAFFPIPKVDSAVIRVEMESTPLIAPELINTFFHLAKAGFSQKRKNLRNSLSAGLRLSTSETNGMLLNCSIDPIRRAETLSIKEWSILTHEYLQLIK
ncbi:MAG: 16S rRNA (adenine(1518)-N(6)/adenine(1519)-N(6))-dimethyltransferase RsmA [Chloroflexota bacterium]